MATDLLCGVLAYDPAPGARARSENICRGVGLAEPEDPGIDVASRTCSAASCCAGSEGCVSSCAWGCACACACAWALPAHCSGSGARSPGRSLPGALLVPSPALDGTKC